MIESLSPGSDMPVCICQAGIEADSSAIIPQGYGDEATLQPPWTSGG
jgi:hypothetical protein